MEDMESTLSNLTQMLPALIAIKLLQAKVYKATYDAFVEQGFTKKEALEILKSRGIHNL